jgi:hypothetical protein
MPRKLKNIVLDEVSGVDVPADPNAKITLFKRGEPMKEEDLSEAQRAKMMQYMDKGYSKEEAMKMCMSGEKTEKGGHDMDPQELAEKLEALEGQVDDLTKRAESAEAEAASLKKQADEAGFDISEEGKLEKRADPEYVEIDGEKFEKSAVPAPLLKRLEEQAKSIEKMQTEAKEVELSKRGASELPHLKGSDLAKGKLLDLIDDEEIISALKAADAALKKQMEEIGSNPLNDEASATFRLNKMARDYATEKGVSYEIGYAEVTKSGEGAKLMAEARSEAN